MTMICSRSRVEIIIINLEISSQPKVATNDYQQLVIRNILDSKNNYFWSNAH